MQDYAASFVHSAQPGRNAFHPLDDTRRWLKAQQDKPGYAVERIRLDELDQWHFDADTGDLCHDSGRFFRIGGLDCRPPDGAPAWQQPIIHQPEIGILGILTKDFGGVRHFLMQAKMEPGNINRVQLSPTVQATYSNYTQAHKGRLPAYLAHFLDSGDGVIRSQLQSETGTRFFRKQNRNVLLDVRDDVELLPGFRWLTLHDIQALMAVDDAVNMDARSVLSNVPFAETGGAELGASPFLRSLTWPLDAAHRGLDELEAWLLTMRARHTIAVEPLPLRDVRDWRRDDWGIRHLSRNHFTVAALRVEAGDREVSRWTQPILAHEGLGLAGFLCAEIGGVLHFLMQAKPEPGIIGGVELAPTVSVFDPGARPEAPESVPYLEDLLDPPAGEILHSSIQSEEGGRFWKLRNRFLVRRLSAPERVAAHERFQWLTLAQLQYFSQGECRVNSEARTLLSCLPCFQ